MTDDLRRHQQQRLKRLLETVLPANRFYANKFAGCDPADFTRLPFTTKADLAKDQADHPPYGTNRTRPDAAYTRLHQTSGTSTGRPLRWLDTPETWDWLLHCWTTSLPFIGLGPRETVFFPFSFGPFLGFWTAFEALARAGHLCLAGGGMTSTARLRYILDHNATVVFATPTYALHLAEIAAQEGIDLAASAVKAIVVAGEPGGGIPATRARIEHVWGARVFDHYGMTEVGPVAIEATETPGSMFVLETEYIAEVLKPGSNEEVAAGEYGELVLTNLGRTDCPVIRYRTGDLVKPATGPCPRGLDWLRLDGGVLGRADDMLHVRGNNLYPAALEAIIRRYPVAEYRILVDRSEALTDLRIEVEPEFGTSAAAVVDGVTRGIRDELLFRVAVTAVPAGSLPRHEMKARRVVVNSTGTPPTTT